MLSNQKIVDQTAHLHCLFSGIVIRCLEYYINITFPDMVIVENVIPRNVIINRGAAEVDNHISRDDIFDYHHIREGNIYFIIPNIRSFFSTVLGLPW